MEFRIYGKLRFECHVNQLEKERKQLHPLD